MTVFRRILVIVVIFAIIISIPVSSFSQSERPSNQHLLKLITDGLAPNYPKGNGPNAVEVYPYDRRHHLYVAIVTWSRGWWDALKLIYIDHDKVQWTKDIDPDPGYAPGISRLKVVTLPGFKEPLIQFYYQTHMGNGFFNIYSVIQNKPVQLLNTFAVDSNWEQLRLSDEDPNSPMISSLIRGDFLSYHYADLNRDGVTDLILEGEIDYYIGKLTQADGADEATDVDSYQKQTLAGTGKWKKVFHFDQNKQRFIMDHRHSYYKSRFKYRAYYLLDDSLN